MGFTSNSGDALAPISLVSVGVIAYNEESALSDLLDDLKAQDFPHERIEIILVDSASTDATKTLMHRFARANNAPGMGFASVRVLDNPKRIIPSGWNIALSEFTGDAFIRVDAHARIPSDFVTANVAVLDEGECVCGGPRPTTANPDTPWTRTLLAAEESAFGSSVANYRRETEKQYVSAVFLPAFRSEVIERIGLYDERLERTEDNDYCYRIREAGYHIRFDGRIHSTQLARNSFARMMKQKYGNGYWVGKTLFIQPKCLHAYHFAPLAFVVGIAAMLLTGAFATWWPFAACSAAYLLVCAALTAKTIAQSARKCVHMLALPLVYASIHIAYGAGTVVGIASGLRNLWRGR